MFSRTWSGLLAPVMTVDTLGLAAHQAIASCDNVQSSSSATADNWRTLTRSAGVQVLN